MKYKIFLNLFLLILIFSLFPSDKVSAQTEASQSFKAEIVQIIGTAEKTREDGSSFTQQDLKLLVLDGDKKGQEIIYHGISDIEVISMNSYEIGDKVFIDSYANENGEEIFYIADYFRGGSLYLLVFIFLVLVVLIGRFKGFKALLSLVLSFFVIIGLILPAILAGRDPFLASLLGGLLILAVIIYLTEGWNRKSHLALLSVLASLSVTLLLSVIFVDLARLSGLAQEEASFLTGIAGLSINFKGLLLAGFIIGAIGVLDDIIVGQIEAVESIREANPNLPKKRLFSLAYRVGNTHLGAIVNTLFLTYTGAAMPVLLLFILNKNTGISFERFINNEMVSTEIVRTLVGSIGVMLSMPIATFLASFFPGKRKDLIDK